MQQAGCIGGCSQPIPLVLNCEFYSFLDNFGILGDVLAPFEHEVLIQIKHASIFGGSEKN